MPRAQTHTANIKMKKKATKKAQAAPINNDSDSESIEGDVTLGDQQSDDQGDVTEDEKSEASEATGSSQNASTVPKFNRKFLDYFWKLRNSDQTSRLNASLEIIKHLQSPHATDAELQYAVGRLVQGLASNKQCSRHGYYVTLLGVLQNFPVSKLSNESVLNTIRTKLKPLEAPTKREHVDQTLAQVLAYGTLLKSGRLTKPGEIKQTVDCMLTASKRRAFMPAIAYGFLAELPQLVSAEVFQNTLWPIFKPIMAKPWSQHNLDTFNLLMAAREKFPAIMANLLPDDNLGSSDLSNPECFKEMTRFIRNTPSESEHPIYTRIAHILAKAGTLCDFWVNHFDPSLFSLKPSKAKTALFFLSSAVKAVDEKQVEKLLAKNITGILINGLRDKEDALHSAAENALKAINAIVTKEDVAPEAQRAIVLQLLKSSGYIFDSVTDTRFVQDASPSFKKETVTGISELYRQFIGETNRKFDRVAVLHHFVKLIHLPVMVRETEWKASCISFFAKWAYFTPSVSPQVLSAMRESFHKSLDSPCRSLKDLSVLLGLVHDQVNELIPDSELPEVVKSTWSNVSKSVKNIQKKQKKTRAAADSWMEQTFLILYCNMAFELLRDPVMPSEIIAELDTCYAKANERQSTRRVKQETNGEEPQWLQVITDILLSLLSRDQHLLRSVVVLVWSLLAEHLNKDVVQQVLDVLDPSKSEMPLVEEDDESGEDEEEEDESDEEEENDKSRQENGEDSDESDAEDDMDDDDMDEDMKETVVDKLRMKIHEALGDGAALTDTESVDMDDLSDNQMESLDRALGAAFREFRKARPVRKKNKKMPKDQTALMHFRLRCLDLIEVLGDKEVNIEIIAAAMLSLITLLEFTVKEPLQKPLMTRTGAVLRKLTNVRHFKGSPEETTETLDKLLQTLFQKPYLKRSLTPYISEDLVHCCSFVLRSAVHMIPAQKSKKQQEPRVKLDKIFQQYKTNMSKFFRKRDSPVPLGIFTRALAYPWPDAGFFIEPLAEFAFSPTIINNRKLQAFHLLTALFRNSAALAALGQPLLAKLVKDLVHHSQRVLEEAGSDSKPKYFHELLVLLRAVVHCAQLTGSPELFDALKQPLIAFRSKGLAKQKDLKKAHAALCRSLGIELAPVAPVQNKPAQTVVVAARADEPAKETTTTSETKESSKAEQSATKANGLKKKVKRGKHAGQLEKKEAKKRRMEAAAEGFAGVSFPTANADIQVPDVDDEDNDEPVGQVVHDEPKKTPKKKAPANQPERIESTPSKQKKQPEVVQKAPATPKTPKRPSPATPSAATPSSAKKPRKTPAKTPKRSAADDV